MPEGWTTLTSGTTADLNGVWGSGPNDVYVVGNSGTVLHSVDGIAWTPLTSGTSVALNAVWGSGPTDVYIVGGSGTILHGHT